MKKTKRKKTYEEYINGRATNISKKDYNSIDEENDDFDWFKYAVDHKEISEGDDYVLYSYESYGVTELPSFNLVIKHGHDTIVLFNTVTKEIKTLYIR